MNKHYGQLLTSAAALFLLWGMKGCSTSERRSPGSSELAEEGRQSVTATLPPITAELRTHAETFDRFLKNALSDEESETLFKTCELSAARSPFCYSILNRDELEDNFKQSKRARVVPRGGKRVNPKKSGEKITNWSDLKKASVNSLLRGLNNASDSTIKLLRTYGAQETQCPNNISIALAATLEDDLPDKVDLSELASLYKKGGECFNGPVTDQEVILTRAGLFYFLKKDFAEAEGLFMRASSLEGVYVGRPLYWLYRTQKELGKKEAASVVYELLNTKYPFSFHALIAASASGKDPGEVLGATQHAARRRSQHLSSANTLLDQVEILLQAGFRESASKVLDWTIAESKEAEPELKLYLAELKREEGDYLSKLMILSDVLYKNPALVSKETMELYFPKVFFPVFEKFSAGIDPFFLLSVARQESAFNAKAVSSANARGLLQVQPATGRRFYKNGKLNLMDPETNVSIGAKYLSYLINEMNGQVHLALAAYNAGEARVLNWSLRYATSEPILFIDLIPYRETREYIASILRNYYWYRRIHQADEKMPSRVLNPEITLKDG